MCLARQGADLSPLKSLASGAWQLNVELGALAGFALRPDAPVHALHGFVNHGQADARAVDRVSAVQALEEGEDTFVVSHVEPQAFVLDAQAREGAGGLGRQADFGRAARAAEFDRVVQQVAQHHR